MGDPRPVLVVKTFDSWERIRKKIRGHILIPMFYDNDIIAPVQNTTIFIYGETEPCTGHDALELRPRKISTIRDALRQAGMDEKRIEKLIRDTYGLYIPMKKFLFNGRTTNQPEWLIGLDDEIKKIALLIGKWDGNSEGDRRVIETLSGIKYEHFMRGLEPFMKGEDPFVIRVKDDHGEYYSLASIEDAWELVDVSIDKALWQSFLVETQRVLGTPERRFTYSQRELLSALLRKETPAWSRVIRQGMLRTLIMWRVYKDNKDYGREIDQVIQHVFSSLENADHWKYISLFLAELCEISPELVLGILEKEFVQPSGLLDLMAEEVEDTLFDTDFRYYIIWGIETLLVQRKHVARAARFLGGLDSCVSDGRSKPLQGVFEKLFCSWYDFSALETPEEKRETAESLMDLDNKMWEHVLRSLPYHHPAIIGDLHKPLYRDHAEPRPVTTDIVVQTAEKYIDLLLAKITDDPEKWKELLQVSWEFVSGDREEMFQKLRESLPGMPDDTRLVIKETLQDKISQHRHFNEASWAVEENIIREYETVMEEISFENPEYEYVVFFADNYRNYLLHPVPYHTENSFHKNEDLCREEIKKAVESFQENDHKLDTLADLCVRFHPGNTLGRALADYWQPEGYHSAIMKTLYEAQESGYMAADYLYWCAVRNPAIMPEVLSEVQNGGNYDLDFVARVYVTEAKLCGNHIPLIQNADEELKRRFWEREFFSFPKETTKWALDECRQYGTVHSYVHLLYSSYLEKVVSEEELYDYLDGVEGIAFLGQTRDTGFILGDLLEPVQKRLLAGDDDAKIMRVARIEIFFYSILSWDKMKCFRYHIQMHPDFYLLMVSYLYREDGSSGKEPAGQEEENLLQNFENLFGMALFCPGERNGVVRREDIFRWVDDFRKGLINLNRSRLFGHLLGRLLAYSPVGADGHSPCEAVRDIIEQYGDDVLMRSYRTAIVRKRGIYTVTGGEAELKIAQAYEENADALRIKYPRTAAIYDGLYEAYMAEYGEERERAEHDRG